MKILKTALSIFVVFLLMGLISLPFKAMRFSSAIEEMQSVRASIGNGWLFAVLGGYRSLVADFIWIKSYVCWENKDIARCVSSMELACAIDPQMTMFWVQGASVIAFDIPHWQFERLPKKMQTDEKMELMRVRQARQAIAFIDKGLAMFPDSYELLIQKGQVAIGAKLFDIAEQCYGKASELNDGFYARRIYASLLEKNGKFSKAIPVLEKLLSEAEADNPARKLIAEQLLEVRKLAELAK